MKSKILAVLPLFLVISLSLGLVIAQSLISFVKFEAETGTISGAVTSATDANAGGGGYIQFNQPTSSSCPSGQVGTPPNCFSSSSALGVNASQVVNPFDRRMKGLGLANWTFTKIWGRSFVGEIQNLPQAFSALDPGLIRYAGGLWANWVGFDGVTQAQRPAYTNWTKNGLTYSFSYGTDELIDLDKFAKSINAEVMIQVNISNNDPAMWANLVRFVRDNNLSNIKYYEFGNELDLETFVGNSTAITPTQYATRLAAYQQAMLAVDPNIGIVGGVPAATTDIMRTGWVSGGNTVSPYITQALPAARNAGKDLHSASIHWYQADSDVSDIFRWTFGINSTSSEWWRQAYSRSWSGDVAPWVRSSAMGSYPNVELGISELGLSSSNDINYNGNHMGALWFSDVLGRFAYSGIDWITEWDSYALFNEDFSLMYPDRDGTATPNIRLRPTYYAFLMYSKFFGDQMVSSSTTDPTRISIWASKDSDDQNKLKLRITNLSNSAITMPVALNGFTATSGLAYIMSSTNPTDTSETSVSIDAPTTLNGVKLDGNNVNSSLATVQPSIVSVSGTSFTYTFPAYSSVAIVLNGNF